MQLFPDWQVVNTRSFSKSGAGRAAVYRRGRNWVAFTAILALSLLIVVAANYDPRAAVARGQAIFNSKPINITGVAGINDDVSAGGLVSGGISSLQGTCGTCHDTPNVGNHSFPTPLNIGTGDPDSSNLSVNLGGLDIG